MTDPQSKQVPQTFEFIEGSKDILRPTTKGIKMKK